MSKVQKRNLSIVLGTLYLRDSTVYQTCLNIKLKTLYMFTNYLQTKVTIVLCVDALYSSQKFSFMLRRFLCLLA